MIYVATVHWKSDRWLNRQQAYLQHHLPGEFRIYAWLNDLPAVPTDTFYYVNREPVADHATKLNRLADTICADSQREDDLLIFLDGDAFPIANLAPLLQQVLTATPLVAVQRLENHGDRQPHPCFCVTTVGCWRKIQGDWQAGYVWKNNDGQEVTDVGGNLLGRLTAAQIPWTPLRRTNRINLHPLFFGIYGEVIYHHGAGFRKGDSRAELAEFQHRARATLWSRLFPGWTRRRLIAEYLRRMEQNHALSEQVFASIESNWEFYQQFTGVPSAAAVACLSRRRRF